MIKGSAALSGIQRRLGDQLLILAGETRLLRYSVWAESRHVGKGSRCQTNVPLSVRDVRLSPRTLSFPPRIRIKSSVIELSRYNFLKKHIHISRLQSSFDIKVSKVFTIHDAAYDPPTPRTSRSGIILLRLGAHLRGCGDMKLLLSRYQADLCVLNLK